ANIMRRGEIMTKAADRWWTCHGLGTSLLTTTSTTTTSSATPGSSSAAQPSAAADLRFGAGGNATFHLLSSIVGESDGACAVLNQLGKLRCFSELNCSSDVTCSRDELYLEDIGNTSGCRPSWPALPNETQIMAEARLFLQPTGRFMLFLRDPRDLVIASFRAAGAAKNRDCPGLALFAMRHIQPVSRWVNLRHRIVSQLREIDDTRAAVFFFEDFVNNATSIVRSMARFMGVQVSAAMLKSLSDVANGTNSTNKGRRLCLSASVVPGHVGAAMTRLMQRELSTTLWE
ncbi:gly-3, partial [Symbiodinium sp. KB8]